MSIVYICHPYSDDPCGNREKVARICEKIIDSECCSEAVPIPVHLYMYQYIDENSHRDLVMELCLETLLACNEIWVVGNKISDGMRSELRYAAMSKIPMRFFSYEDLGLIYE